MPSRSLASYVLLFSCSLIGICATPASTLAQEPESPTSFQLYYGGEQALVDSMEQSIKPSQIAVVDTRGLTSDQLVQLRGSANGSKAKLIGYISIGELHSRELGLFEAFARKQDAQVDFDKLKSEVLISQNTEFSSLHVDVSHPVWREFVFHKANKIMASGVDGLFLDTVDTVDVYAGKKEWELDRRAKSVTAMISLIRELKNRDSAPFIMQNRGLNLIGEQVFVGDSTGKMIPGQQLTEPGLGNPDAILYENAFSSTGQWAANIKANLDAIRESKEVAVVALGYEDVIKDRGKFLEQCKEHNYIPAWSKNSHGLHLEIAR